MSGLHVVDCRGCGRTHALSAEEARKQRVLRCDCGQFVRMDRALSDVRSEPAPAPITAASSLAAGLARPGKGRGTLASLSDHERSVQPPRTATAAPFRSSSAPPPGDKPLWYVDLGGAETVEMTIEQLIIARRSGKLGEGALVWRAGMPRWRPVGELIPASSAWRPSPPPAPAGSANALRGPSEPPPSALGSYERPLATLEFALETPGSAAPREPSMVAAAATLNRSERPSQPPRAAAPLPQRAHTPLPQRRPSPVPQLLATPIPQHVPLPRPRPKAASVPALITPPARSVISTAPVTLPLPRADHPDLFNEAPRWRTLSLALLLSVSASASGAFLVRALRSHHQPSALAPTAAPALPATSLANPTASFTSAARIAAAAEPPPRVVDLSSLSVEHAAPRPQPRPAPVIPAKSSEPSRDIDDGEQTPSAPKPQNGDSSATVPDATDSSNVKKPAAASDDEPGF
ncbi:MAG: GYF domain-containing protein [Pseudomonadota bacterium]